MGVHASTLTDNGLVYTPRFVGGRGGRNGFETELARLNVHQKNSRPNHPATTYQTRPKAAPGQNEPDERHRVRTDRIDRFGKLTLRHNGRLHHIGIGRTHARTPVILLIAGLQIRVVNAATGELLRALTLNPTTDYQPTGKPRTLEDVLRGVEPMGDLGRFAIDDLTVGEEAEFFRIIEEA